VMLRQPHLATGTRCHPFAPQEPPLQYTLDPRQISWLRLQLNQQPSAHTLPWPRHFARPSLLSSPLDRNSQFTTSRTTPSGTSMGQAALLLASCPLMLFSGMTHTSASALCHHLEVLSLARLRPQFQIRRLPPALRE
jgi:hypothetical protein